MTVKYQPTASQCFVCGRDNPYGLHLRFLENDDGEVTAEYVVPERYQSYPGVVHGGIVAAMLDEVAGRVFMHADSNRFMYTVKLSIRYRKPVPIGEPLTIKGHAQRDTGRVGMATGEIYDSRGKLLAEADAVYADIPKEDLGDFDPSEVGWKVDSENEETR
jgi:uncharacterized protein (TIGR00369 family)